MEPWEPLWEKIIHAFTILVTLVCQCFLWKVWTNDGCWPTSLACQIIWAAAETIFNSQAGSITRRWAYCIYQVCFTDQIFPHPDWCQYRTRYWQCAKLLMNSTLSCLVWSSWPVDLWLWPWLWGLFHSSIRACLVDSPYYSSSSFDYWLVEDRELNGWMI